MTCEKSRDLFVDYLGEELGKHDAAELRQHLQICPGCRQELAQLADTRSALRFAWPDEEMPHPLTFDFPERGSGKVHNRSSWFGLPRAVVASFSAAACFLLCLAGLAVFQTHIEIRQGTFRISFGQAQAVSNEAPQVSPQTPVRLEQSEIQAMIGQALQRLEVSQIARLQQGLLEVKSEVDANRRTDLIRIAKQMNYLENTQSVVWKEAARNNSYLDTLARDFYLKTSAQQ